MNEAGGVADEAASRGCSVAIGVGGGISVACAVHAAGKSLGGGSKCSSSEGADVAANSKYAVR